MTERQVEVNGPTSPRGLTNAFWKNLTVNAEMCFGCNKRVYATERLSTGNLVYHKACFRCTHCKKILSLSQYTLGDNQPYCKPHYERIFKESGGRYRFGDHSAGSVTGSTPLAARQRSSVEILRAERSSLSPIVTSGGVTSPGLLSPTSSADSDSVGNVKKLTGFAATRALFENASFASPTTPTSVSSRTATPAKPVTPSGIVKEIRAKREAASNQPEVSSPPILHSPRAAEPLSVRITSDRVDVVENDRKASEKEEKPRVEEVKELDDREPMSVQNHRAAEEAMENHHHGGEVQLQASDRRPSVSSQSDDDDDSDYLQLVPEPTEPSVDDKQEENAANREEEDDSDFERLQHRDFEEDSEEHPAPAESRREDGDDSEQLVEELHVEERKQDELAGDGDDELVDSRDEDQHAPAAADTLYDDDDDDDDNNNDDNADKYPDKLNEDDDVTAQQQQQQQQQIDSSDDLM